MIDLDAFEKSIAFGGAFTGHDGVKRQHASVDGETLVAVIDEARALRAFKTEVTAAVDALTLDALDSLKTLRDITKDGKRR